MAADGILEAGAAELRPRPLSIGPGTRLLAAAVWPLLPLLAVQGVRVRRVTPRLPEAQGPCAGRAAGDEPALRVLILGESTAAGVGVARHADGLAGQIAGRLATLGGRSVEWRVLGRTGATARATHAELLPAVAGGWDVVVVVLGVNDVLRLHGPARWHRDLSRLLRDVRALDGDPVVVLAAVPPMGRFPALPQPLRAVLGARAARLDAVARALAAATPQVSHVALAEPDADPAREHFSEDGFHPSAAGYARWAVPLAAAIQASLAARGSGVSNG